MSEYLRFVDATNGSPYYDSAAFSQTEQVKAEGIAYNYLNELEVIQYTGLQVIVKDGGLISNGRTYIQDEPYDGDSPKILTLEAAQAGYLRKDMVVVEFDLQNSVAATKLVKGVEDISNPALPSLTDEPNLWQVCLAVVDVEGTAITNIEDKRVIGNGRTNPVFNEDISAPNIKVNDDGRLYLNDDESAYLRYESDKLSLKLPNKEETEIASRLVAEVVLDSDASSIVIDNLDINADGDTYEFWISGKATAGASISLYINDDITDSNYYRQYNLDYSTSSSGGRYNDASIGAISSNQGQIHGNIWLNTITRKCICQSRCNYDTNGSIQRRMYDLDSVNTFSNITKLTFKMQSSSYFKSGTVIKLFKKD